MQKGLSSSAPRMVYSQINELSLLKSNIGMSTKLFIIDAYALIYRAYYAFIRAPRINSKGLNTSAVFGFVNTVVDALSKEKPTHVCVAFDPSGHTFRHDMFPEYKANRDAQPEDITSNVPLIKDFLRAMNIAMVECPGFEADDVAGSVATQFAPQVDRVILFTPDKDYAQLVTDKIHQMRPGNGASAGEYWDVNGVNEHFSISDPKQVIDILGLWGDSADNIPGCPGVGEKRAKELLAEFGSIDGIYENIDRLKGKLKENLEKNCEQVRLSKVLATIVTDCPLGISLSDIEFQQPDTAALTKLFTELEFRNVLPRIERIFMGEQPAPVQLSLFGDAPADTASETATTEPTPAIPSFHTAKDTPHEYIVCQTDEELSNLASILMTAPEFCFDTETTSLNSLYCDIVGLSFATEAHKAYYVPFQKGNKTEATRRLNFFAEAFSSDKLKIGQNLKYDILVLSQYGISVSNPMFDTMIAHFLLAPTQPHNMDSMSEVLLGYTPIHIEELIGKGAKQITMDQVPLSAIKEYAAEDADITYQLYLNLKEQLANNEIQQRLFTDMEMPLMPVLAMMEMNGVKIDDQALAVFASHLREQLISAEENIYSLAGEKFNISSPKQVGDILFEKMKIDPSAKRNKQGNYSTAEDVLQKLASKSPIVSEILNYRGLLKLLNTYAEALPKLINPRTGRIHTSFNQTVVVTGRLSSNNPNLQNIPIRDESGREIRKAFVASDDEHIILAADYSQVELRLMAHFSQDEHLCAAFQRGEDVHAATAARIFKVDLKDVTKDMRRKAKTANFGIIYGISAVGLADQLQTTRQEAKALIDGYFESFPAVKDYMDKSIAKARELGYSETLFGRRRQLDDINSRNGVVRGVAERNAINAPIQGTAADIIKIAMVNIAARMKAEGLKSKMILQVHDELVFDALKSEQDTLTNIVRECMEHATDKLSVPLIAEVDYGQNWVDAH